MKKILKSNIKNLANALCALLGALGFSQRIYNHIAKAHEPTLQPKLCQRACEANAPKEIVLKNSQLKKIENTDTRAD